jgi:hypothetical protein
MIAHGIALKAVDTAATTVRPVTIAAGIALKVATGLLKSKISAVPKLATGGLAYGPTLAVVGDNPGASSNPEVIAPLNKLQSMMQPQTSNIQLGGKFTIDGRNLVYLVEENSKILERFR